MNVRFFGGAIVLLGVILGCAAAYYGIQPKLMHSEWFEAFREAIHNGGHSASLGKIETQFEIFRQRAYIFGVSSGIVGFLGIALILSAKRTPKMSDHSIEAEIINSPSSIKRSEPTL